MAPKVKRRRGLTRISSKNQVTLPVAVLAEVHLGPGDNLHVEAAGDGKILLVREREPLEQFIGSLPGLEEAVNLQALRDEWER